VCDLKTVVLVGSARLTSAERVATGVGCRSRDVGTETNSLTGVWRPTLLCIPTSAPLNQDGDINRTIIGKTTQATNCERNLTSPTQNGKLTRKLYYRSTTTKINAGTDATADTKQYQNLSQTRLLTKTRCGVEDISLFERHNIQSIQSP